ncbi:MAG: hypothetical protein LBF42_03050 [Puniceicoccales bacterium]|jgi:hypothetical protein|nr:hypothetical protein [Puniceicoccales bacterium]
MTSTVKNQFNISPLANNSIAARVRSNPRRCVQKNGNNVQPNPKSDARSKSMNSRKPETPKQEVNSESEVFSEPEVTFENQDKRIAVYQPEPEEQKKPFFNAKNALIAGVAVLSIAGGVLAVEALSKKSGDGESESTDDLNSTPQESRQIEQEAPKAAEQAPKAGAASQTERKEQTSKPEAPKAPNKQNNTNNDIYCGKVRLG